MKRVLALTTEPLPLPAGPTTGAGLRAWGLAEGLRSAGLDVIIATPLHGDESLPDNFSADFNHVRFFRRDAIDTLIRDSAPDVIVLQHWGLAAEVPDLRVPLVIDLAGPHLLERQYWGSTNPNRDREEKLEALRRADFVTCGGYVQREYFKPFLAEAGFDTDTFNPPVIPFSVPPAMPGSERKTQHESTFIFGGAFLAWQDPSQPLIWLLDEMERAGKGRLLFYGGSHPVVDASAGKFAGLVERLRAHPRVEMRGWRPFDQLVEEYRAEGDVALDLMARNPERELAFTTRTMIYLYCGLPVIYNDFSEISAIIHDGECGWILDPEDEPAFRELVRGLLSGGGDLNRLRENAVRMASNYCWNDTIGPLADFCNNPSVREGKLEQQLAHEAARRDLAVGKRGPTCRQRLRPGRFLAPVVYLAALPLRYYLWVKFRKSVVDKSHG